jgi:hypothetical protein
MLLLILKLLLINVIFLLFLEILEIFMHMHDPTQVDGQG